MTEMKSLTLNDKTYNSFVDSVARSQLEATMVVGSASGETIAVSDASNYKFVELHVYGKTTQDGTPAPDAPVELVSVGVSGSITVNVTGDHDAQSMTIATPNGLPGVPVTSGGNYTDEDGQQWICDEIDLARGVTVHRLYKAIYNGSEDWARDVNGLIYLNRSDMRFVPKSLTPGLMCSHFRTGVNIGVAMGNTYGITFYSDDFSDLNSWKAWLAQNPIAVIYERETPIETPLSEEELAAYAALHTYRGNTTVSNDASAHMEIEYVMDAKKYIDSLVKAPPAWITNVTLRASAWTGSNSLYSQVVTIPGITEYSKVDLLPSVEQLAIFHNKDVAFVTENEDGVVTVYAIGDKPTLDYTMQAQITEVEV